MNETQFCIYITVVPVSIIVIVLLGVLLTNANLNARCGECLDSDPGTLRQAGRQLPLAALAQQRPRLGIGVLTHASSERRLESASPAARQTAK